MIHPTFCLPQLPKNVGFVSDDDDEELDCETNHANTVATFKERSICVRANKVDPRRCAPKGVPQGRTRLIYSGINVARYAKATGRGSKDLKVVEREVEKGIRSASEMLKRLASTDDEDSLDVYLHDDPLAMPDLAERSPKRHKERHLGVGSKSPASD